MITEAGSKLTTRELLLRPRDPLLVRDARPFSAEPGSFARSLPWPLPSTLAGALRTTLGNGAGVDWGNASERDHILFIGICGVFRAARRAGSPWVTFATAPLDALPYTDARNTKRMLHLVPDEGLNPLSGVLWPEGENSLLPLHIKGDDKPDSGLDWWSFSDLLRWLEAPRADRRPDWHLPELNKNVRTHVSVDGTTQTAREGHLFSTESRAFSPAPIAKKSDQADAIICRLVLPAGFDNVELSATFVPLGGERRLTALSCESSSVADGSFDLPKPLIKALKGKTRFRLLLLTPAFFQDAWQPAASGRLASLLPQHKLTLRSASIGRRIPVSGWDFAEKRAKATRYAVPAGSVYFFETKTPLGDDDIQTLWMTSISDTDQDQRDGFGIVVPGVWPEWTKGDN